MNEVKLMDEVVTKLDFAFGLHVDIIGKRGKMIIFMNILK